MLKQKIDNTEKYLIAKALLQHGRNHTHTAKYLGIARRTLLNKINKYKLRTVAGLHEIANQEVDKIFIDAQLQLPYVEKETTH